jgi:Flp pilus assembly protein TadD
MFISSRISRLLPLAVCLPLLGGCGVVMRVAPQIGSSITGGSSAGYIASLKPLASGNGVLIFEPVATPSVQSLADWGSGASRWLQVQVGGQGELGKTPSWGIQWFLQRHLNINPLRLSDKQALEAGRIAGVTHIVVGDVAGKPERPTLHYALLAVATKKKVGEWRLTGSPAQLAAKLPQTARQMAQTLGVKTPQAAPQVTLTADELAFLGRQPIHTGFRRKTPAADQARLKALAPKDALAGITVQRICEFDNAPSLATTLSKQAPKNALVWNEIATCNPEGLMTLHGGLESLSLKYPNNYALARARTKAESGNKMRLVQVQWAETAVKASPGNVYAWIDLADAQGDAAQEIRKGKYSRQMTWQESQQVNAIYPKAMAAAQKATQVEAQESYAWSELAEAATFEGDSNLANSALQKAIALDSRNSDAWSWGMQMTQTKWGGTMQGYTAFIQQAAQHADQFEFDAGDATSVFTNDGQHAALKPILQTVVAKDPQNVEALMELGAIYHYEDRSYRKAEELYKQALAINPNDSRSNSALGDLTYWVHHDPAGAEALYRRGIAGNPRDGYVHANLGRLYALTGRMPQAVAEAQQAKALNFSDSTHPIWQATGVTPP